MGKKALVIGLSYKDCDENKYASQNVEYPIPAQRSWCNKCKPCSDWCDDTNDCNSADFNKGKRTKYVPIFKTTYVGRATRHIPMDFIDYYDCSKQRGGTCGSTNNIATDNVFSWPPPKSLRLPICLPV